MFQNDGFATSRFCVVLRGPPSAARLPSASNAVACGDLWVGLDVAIRPLKELLQRAVKWSLLMSAGRRPLVIADRLSPIGRTRIDTGPPRVMLVMLVMLGESDAVVMFGWDRRLVPILVLGGTGWICDTLPDLPHVDPSYLWCLWCPWVRIVLLAIGWAGATLGQSGQLAWISMQRSYDSGRRAGT